MAKPEDNPIFEPALWGLHVLYGRDQHQIPFMQVTVSSIRNANVPLATYRGRPYFDENDIRDMMMVVTKEVGERLAIQGVLRVDSH